MDIYDVMHYMLKFTLNMVTMVIQFYYFRDRKAKVRRHHLKYSTKDQGQQESFNYTDSSACEVSHSSSPSSWGEPSSPPPTSPESSNITPTSPCNSFQNNYQSTTKTLAPTVELDEELGVDVDALAYELDYQTSFMLDDGTLLEKEALTNFLLTSNNRLKDKVKKYVHQLEETKKKMHKERSHYKEKIENIQYFYRDVLYYGNSLGAVIKKNALN